MPVVRGYLEDVEREREHFGIGARAERVDERLQVLQIRELRVGWDDVLKNANEGRGVMRSEFFAPALCRRALYLQKLVGLPALQRGRLGELVEVHSHAAVCRLLHVSAADHGVPARHLRLEAAAGKLAENQLAMVDAGQCIVRRLLGQRADHLLGRASLGDLPVEVRKRLDVEHGTTFASKNASNHTASSLESA